MNRDQEKKVYRVYGLTCASCAARFEENVKKFVGVKEAKVNFGAGKITVSGEITIKDLEKAGAFERLKVVPDKPNSLIEKQPFWKEQKIIQLFFSALFLLLGWIIGLKEGAFVFSISFYVLSMLIGGYRLFRSGLLSLFRLKFDMYTLMTIAVFGAAAIGEWGEGATVVVLFAISELLETYSMDRARRSIHSLLELAPKQALIRRDGTEEKIAVEHIQVGNLMIVKPGEKLAMDGVVIKGESTVNQATITGESIPVSKTIGDEVFAGTLNEEGLLEVTVTKRVEDTTMAKIIHLVEEAQAERAPSQAFVDRFAQVYTPAILIVALLLITIPPIFFHAAWGDWIYRGLALLVVGCPCALVISTPVSIVTAIGNAARHGVLIKGGIYLEETGTLKSIAFDKTGTLTKGVPVVTDYMSLINGKEVDFLGIAAAIEKSSQHPLASAILRKADQEKIDIDNYLVDDFLSITGKGVRAKVNRMIYYVGSPNFFEEMLPNRFTTDLFNTIEHLQQQGKTVMLLGTEIEVLALFAVADPLRESSRIVIEKLHRLGIKKTVMLTGDHVSTAKAVGSKVGISEIKADLLPQEKLDVMKQLKSEVGSVGMVGDGVNDAPALAAATVGIAMGGAGSDTALETADIALMADDLEKLPFTIKLSRKTLQIIKQNITLSLMMKAIALLLILPGLLTLWMAIFADMGATLIVTLNGLRLLKVNRD